MSLLTGIDAVVFDVDGTLLHANDPSGPRGAHPIAGAAETVERVRASGRRVLFFTNGTGRPPAQYAADIRALGFMIADEEFMNPAVVAARWIARRHAGNSVLVLGGPGVVAPLHDLGIETIAAAEPAVADVVLVGWDDVLTYAALRAACESIWAGAPLLATSTASVFSVNGGAAPGWSGAIAAGIRQTTGARAVTLGKPSPIALREACRTLGVKPARTLVVGDDLGLEIAMARRAGARSALVLTGVGTRAQADACPPSRRPDAVLARRHRPAVEGGNSGESPRCEAPHGARRVQSNEQPTHSRRPHVRALHRSTPRPASGTCTCASPISSARSPSTATCSASASSCTARRAASPVPPSSPPATTTITLHSTPGRARVARRRRQAIPASTTSRSYCPTSTRSRTWSAACWRRATRSTAHSTTAAPSRSTCATPTATASSSTYDRAAQRMVRHDGEMILKADPFDPQELLYAQPA